MRMHRFGPARKRPEHWLLVGLVRIMVIVILIEIAGSLVWYFTK